MNKKYRYGNNNKYLIMGNYIEELNIKKSK